MKENEILVLGANEKKKRYRLWGVFAASLLLLAIAVIFMVKRYGKSVEVPQDTISTIDIELQHAVDSLLTAELELISGTQGQAIVMDVETGEILAMAGRERRFDKQLYPCENFAYQQEPGSLMMTVALLTLLETGEVKLTDEVDAESGVWEVDDKLMVDHNWRRGGYGKITLERALEVSSNIAITKTVRKIFNGKEQHYYDMLDKMSFGKPDHVVGISGLKPMAFSSPKDSTWARRQLLWNAIGCERLIAPIQMLTFYNAIANNGRMVKPTLVKGKTEVINEQIANKESLNEIQKALYSVVCNGFGKKAGLTVISVAGKTGTTVQVAPQYEEENMQEHHLSFCGYFPAEAPKYSIIVSLNKLGLPASGGGMAGVLFHDIAEWMVTHDRPTLLYVDEDMNDTTKVAKLSKRMVLNN